MKGCARHISLCLTVGYQFPRRNHHIRIPLRINLIGLCQKAHIHIRDTYLPDLPPRKYWRGTIPYTSQRSIDIRALGSHYLVYQLDSNTKPLVTLNYRCLALVHGKHTRIITRRGTIQFDDDSIQQRENGGNDSVRRSPRTTTNADSRAPNAKRLRTDQEGSIRLGK